MNLEDALGGGWPAGGNNQSGGGSAWPGQPPSSSWPGQPAVNPTWPSGGGGAWPGQPGQPSQPGQPGQPTWPSQPGQPSQPSQPAWPSPSPQPPAPGGWPSPPPGPGPAIPVTPQQNLTVPHKLTLPNGVYDRLLITIAGTIKRNADKITVDMYTASNDLAFHFNPRFNEGGKKVIVRNSRIGNKWGREERNLERFPFSQGESFEMKILCTNSEFKVAVNNSHLLTFQHRIRDLGSIKALNIYNDLDLSKVHMENVS